MNLTRIKKTLFALLFGAGQEFFFQFLSVFLWIRYWGVGLYSEWLLISLLPMLIVRGNTGLSHGATSKLIYQYARNEYSEAGATYSALLAAQNFFLYFVAVLYIGAALVASLFLEFGHLSYHELSIIVLLFTLQFALFQRQQCQLCIVKASGRAPSAVAWQNRFRLASIVFLLAPSPFFGPVVCLTLAIMGQLVVLLLTAKDAKSSFLFDPLTDFDRRAQSSEVRYLLKKGIQFSLFPFGQTALHTGTVWLLGLFFGALAGSAYHNMRTISRSIVLFARAGEQAARFELSELFAKRQLSAASKLVSSSIRISIAFSVLAVTGLIVVGETVFRLLTDGALEFELAVYAILCAGSLLYSVSQAYMAVPFSLNRQGGITRAYAFITVCTLLMSLPAAYSGALAVAALLMLSEMVFLVVIVVQSKSAESTTLK